MVFTEWFEAWSRSLFWSREHHAHSLLHELKFMLCSLSSLIEGWHFCHSSLESVYWGIFLTWSFHFNGHSLSWLRAMLSRMSVGPAVFKWIPSLRMNSQLHLFDMKASTLLRAYVSPVFYLETFEVRISSCKYLRKIAIEFCRWVSLLLRFTE